MYQTAVLASRVVFDSRVNDCIANNITSTSRGTEVVKAVCFSFHLCYSRGWDAVSTLRSVALTRFLWGKQSELGQNPPNDQDSDSAYVVSRARIAGELVNFEGLAYPTNLLSIMPTRIIRVTGLARPTMVVLLDGVFSNVPYRKLPDSISG